jgi:hypothetical protein
MINIKKLDLRKEIVFQRVWRGQYQVIAVSRLFNYLERTNYPQVSLGLTKEKAISIRDTRCIEMSRLLKITAEHLKIPCILIEEEGGPDLIDGNHRYIKAYLFGRLFLPAYLVAPTIWRQYLVKGIAPKTADEILATGSGLT